MDNSGNNKRAYELTQLYKTPANRRLKYIAMGVISIAIMLMIVMIIFLDRFSLRAMLWMRGTVGVATIIFVILYAVLVYRVYREYYRR